MADPIWWFYLFWGAKFLYSKFGIELKEIGIPFFTIYLVSWLLGIFLGWLSSWFLKEGDGHQPGPETGNAGVRTVCPAGGAGAPYRKPASGGDAHCPGGRGALWLVGQRLFTDVGHVPQKSHRISGRIRGICRELSEALLLHSWSGKCSRISVPTDMPFPLQWPVWATWLPWESST